MRDPYRTWINQLYGEPRMPDDDKHVDATIRPVLPSRAAIPAPDVPQFDLAKQVERLGVDSLLPDWTPPKKETSVKRKMLPRGTRHKDVHPKSKPDARRSVAARDAWKTRRKNEKAEAAYAPGPVLIALTLASKLTDEELGGFRAAVEMLQKLPASSRKLVLDALVKVFP